MSTLCHFPYLFNPLLLPKKYLLVNNSANHDNDKHLHKHFEIVNYYKQTIIKLQKSLILYMNLKLKF